MSFSADVTTLTMRAFDTEEWERIVGKIP